MRSREPVDTAVEAEGGTCIDEDQALDFVQGLLAPPVVQQIDEHADRCVTCRALIGEAVRAFRERATEPGLQATPLTRFQPGDKLAGRYQVVRFIARGGMGEVYEAEDLILNTRIALKTLAATLSDDEQAIRRLKLEVNLARRITHPSVCRIFDIGVHEQPGNTAGGILFITMELIPGVSLGQRLREQGALPVSEARPIVEAMVAALGAAHRAGIIHRDFKSDNVMIAPPPPEGGPPRVVVMDFGLARASVPGIPSISTTFDSRSLVGTLAYMAPEQLQGKPVTAATDIYALGVVMFEMITGQLPFDGGSALEAASRRLSEDPRSPAELIEQIDPRVEATIMRCLARDPEQRFAAVEDVARSLIDSLLGPQAAVSGGSRRRATSHEVIPSPARERGGSGARKGGEARPGSGGRRPGSGERTGSGGRAQPSGRATVREGAASGAPDSEITLSTRGRLPLWRLWPVAVGVAVLGSALVVAAVLRRNAHQPAPVTTTAQPAPSTAARPAGAPEDSPARPATSAPAGTGVAAERAGPPAAQQSGGPANDQRGGPTADQRRGLAPPPGSSGAKIGEPTDGVGRPDDPGRAARSDRAGEGTGLTTARREARTGSRAPAKATTQRPEAPSLARPDLAERRTEPASAASTEPPASGSGDGETRAPAPTKPRPAPSAPAAERRSTDPEDGFILP